MKQNKTEDKIYLTMKRHNCRTHTTSNATITIKVKRRELQRIQKNQRF